MNAPRWLCFLVTAGAAFAQYGRYGGQYGQYTDTRRASIIGSYGDRGKCTIEVDVDGAAEIEIRGDSGRIRTLSGQPAVWRRFECTSPLPVNPADFRFRGIDGRGDVNLVQDPRGGRGVAVVRIDDRKGGREGYTFDLEWTGGTSGYYPQGGGNYPYSNDPYNNGRYDRRRDGYSDGAYAGDRRYDRYTVNCGTAGNRRTYCEADTQGGVRLMREYGNGACRQGSTWGYDRRGIWVDRGCSAEFEVGRR